MNIYFDYIFNRTTLIDDSEDDFEFNLEAHDSHNLYFDETPTLSIFTRISMLFNCLDQSKILDYELTLLNQNNNSTSSEENSDTIIDIPDFELIDLEARAQIIEAHAEENEEIYNNTIFVRCKLKDLNPELEEDGDEDVDLTVGIDGKTGKYVYAVVTEDLRPIPMSPKMQYTIIGAAVCATFLSNRYIGEGIITKGLLNAVTAFALPKILKIPNIPPIVGPMVATGMIYGSYWMMDNVVTPLASNATRTFLDSEFNVHLKFSTVIGVGLCALLYKRAGKAFSKGGFASVKEYVIPVGVKESSLIQMKDRIVRCLNCSSEESIDAIEDSDELPKTVKIIDIEKAEGSAIGATVAIQLILTVSDRDMFYNLRVNETDIGEQVRMANAADVDDDDDDGSDVEKPKDKEKPSVLSVALKKGCLYLGSGAATIVSKYFYGEGLLTTAINTIFSASVKAEFRQQPILHSYGILTLASGVLLSVKLLWPNSLIGDLTFMPVNIIISKGNKDFKDLGTGKRLKNRNFYEIPLILQQFAQKHLSWVPNHFEGTRHRLSQLLDDDNSRKLEISLNAQDIHANNDESSILKAKFKIKSEKMSGVYVKLNKKDLEKMHLARLKGEKVGKWAEASFLASSVVLTLVASYATKQSQLNDLSNKVRIPAEKLGEGVVTNILNSVIATYMKQMGKDIPPVTRYGVGGIIAASALGLEGYLLSIDKLPFLFAGIPASAFLGPLSKQSKAWVFNKSYGTTKGYITSEWPTDKDLTEQKNKLSAYICGDPVDSYTEKLSEVITDDVNFSKVFEGELQEI